MPDAPPGAGHPTGGGGVRSTPSSEAAVGVVGARAGAGAAIVLAALSLSGLGALIAGRSWWTVVATIMTVAIAMAGRTARSVVDAIPLAAAAVLVSAVVVGMVAEATPLDLAARGTATAVLAGGLAAATVVAALGARRARLSWADGRAVAMVPAALVGIVLLGAMSAGERASTFVQGGDHVAHAAIAADLADHGDTRYFDDWDYKGYPVAAHQLAAIMLRADDREDPSLRAVVGMLAGVEAAAYVVLVAASGSLVAALLRAAGRDEVSLAFAGGAIVAMVLVLHSFYAFTVGYGFLASIVAAALFVLAPLEAIRLRTKPDLLCMSLAVVALAMAHTYQVGAPVVAAAFVPGAWRAWRRGWRPARATVVAVGLAFVASTVPGWSILYHRGTDHIEVAGSVAPLPTTGAVAVFVAATVLVVGATRRRVMSIDATLASLAAGAALVVALAASAGGGWQELAYYPRKALWHLVAVAVPVLVAAVLALAAAAFPRGRGAPAVLGAALTLATAMVIVPRVDVVRRAVEGRAGPAVADVAFALQGADVVASRPPAATAWVVGTAEGYYDAQLTGLLTVVQGRTAPPSEAIVTRDAATVCAHLAARPGSVVIDLGSGIDLRAAGCTIGTVDIVGRR
jgi:hypothetical protein